MSGLVKSAKSTLPVRLLALRLVRRNGQKDWPGEVRDIHAFVRDGIRYVKDVRGVETLQTPEKTLELGQGDCDDKSTLVAALLESIGHPTRFVAVGFNGQFAHVLVETKIGTKWVAVETTEPVAVGWFPKNVTMVMRWHN
jgi:transglutaminase-like putative cysteine protease